MSQEQPESFDLRLERIALGELKGSNSQEEVADLERLALSSKSILAELPVDSVVREVERRRRLAQARQAPRSRSVFFVGLAGVAMAAAILFLILRSDSTETTQLVATHNQGDPYAGPGETRSKGDDRLLIHLQAPEGSVELRDGNEAKVDDRLQLTYLAAEERYGVIVSIDGRDTVTLHLPESPGHAVLLSRGKHPLPSSYQLDDAPEFERFYLVTASEPFKTDTVIKALATKEDDKLELQLESHFGQSVFTLRKVQP